MLIYVFLLFHNHSQIGKFLINTVDQTIIFDLVGGQLHILRINIHVVAIKTI